MSVNFFSPYRKLRKMWKLGQKGNLELQKHCVLHLSSQNFQKVWLCEGLNASDLWFSFVMIVAFILPCWPVLYNLNSGTLCFASGKLAKKWSFWGRSYWWPVVGVFSDSVLVKSCSFGISDTNLKIHLHCVLHRLAVLMSSLLTKAICSSIHCYLSLDVARMRRHTFVYWHTVLL